VDFDELTGHSEKITLEEIGTETEPETEDSPEPSDIRPVLEAIERGDLSVADGVEMLDS